MGEKESLQAVAQGGPRGQVSEASMLGGMGRAAGSGGGGDTGMLRDYEKESGQVETPNLRAPGDPIPDIDVATKAVSREASGRLNSLPPGNPIDEAAGADLDSPGKAVARGWDPKQKGAPLARAETEGDEGGDGERTGHDTAMNSIRNLKA